LDCPKQGTAGEIEYYGVRPNAVFLHSEEQIKHSMDRVTRLRDKAVKRRDSGAAVQIGKIERVIDVVQRRIARMK
jgi:hypothetical protein